MYKEEAALSELHSRNISGEFKNHDLHVIPQKEADAVLPASFMKHAQSPKRLAAYLDANPSARDQIINKKGETLQDRQQRHMMDLQKGDRTLKVSNSIEVKRRAEIAALADRTEQSDGLVSESASQPVEIQTSPEVTEQRQQEQTNLSRHSTVSSLPEALAQEKAEAKAQKKADKAEAKAQKLAEKAEADAARQADRERLRFNPAQDAAKPKRMNEETSKSAADAALASLDKRDAQKAADIAATDKKLSVFQQVDQAKWKAVRNQDYAKDVPPPPVPAPKAAFGRMPQPLPSIPENAAARSGPGTSQPSLSLIPGKMQKTPNPPDHDPMGSTLAVNAAPDAPSHSLWGSTIAVNNASNPPNHDPMGSTLAVNAAPDAPSHSLWGSTNAVNNTPNPPRQEPGAQEEPRVPPMMERWAQNR
ncbi:hypothetical protein AB838_04405 [Rhodobacteraceae bacterium (ex Bugula neritina AB1)]|nr:hypothetical protein AB838_04405 [Rhodobacteraceae bacterium (ex Bugula neritina AB1)]